VSLPIPAEELARELNRHPAPSPDGAELTIIDPALIGSADNNDLALRVYVKRHRTWTSRVMAAHHPTRSHRPRPEGEPVSIRADRPSQHRRMVGGKRQRAHRRRMGSTTRLTINFRFDRGARDRAHQIFYSPS
jgi:hypothetical protein